MTGWPNYLIRIPSSLEVIASSGQISGHSDIPQQDTLRLDNSNVLNWFLSSDMKLLVQTDAVVRGGAY